MKKKSEKSGVNKKLLNQMTESAMPQKPKPMMHLSGKDAEAFFDKKPGSKVSARISGVVQRVGMREWANNEPEAEIRITDIQPEGKGK